MFHRGRIGPVMPKLQRERAQRELAEIKKLEKVMSAERRALHRWLKINQKSHFYNTVSEARELLCQQQQAHPTLAEMKHNLADLKALNKALQNKGVDDLVERAKENLAYASPEAMSLGASLAILALGIMALSAIVVCPALMMAVGFGIALFGVGIFATGSAKVSTLKAEGLFGVAKGIDRRLNRESDLLSLDEMPPPLFKAV